MRKAARSHSLGKECRGLRRKDRSAGWKTAGGNFEGRDFLFERPGVNAGPRTARGGEAGVDAR